MQEVKVGPDVQPVKSDPGTRPVSGDPDRQPVRSRREMYSEATRASILDEATRLFAEGGYARTSLEDVASASQVTRGAVYHHFAGKQALFEAVLDLQESRAIAQITAAATADDPWEAAIQALDAFLDQCCDPVYGRLCWLEAPAALGFHRWRECEEKYSYGLVERFITALVDAGYLEDRATGSLVRFSFWILGGAGLTLAEAPTADKPRVREEWRYLIVRTITAMRIR
jgi:AcrR family transcriptional regulator